jgi:hypothetical protein
VYKVHFTSLLGAIISFIWFGSPHEYNIVGEWTLVLFLGLLFTQGIIGPVKGKGNSWEAVNIRNGMVLLFFNIIPLILSLTNYFGFGFEAVVENIVDQIDLFL